MRNNYLLTVTEAKIEFHKNKFETMKSNTNEKWRFINTILNRDKKLMNNFFTCIGSGLASKLPESKTNPLPFLENSCDESFH